VKRKTQLDEVRGVAVDPVRNLIVVASRSQKGTTGLFVFNRNDAGDVAPRGVIAGPKTGILRIRQVAPRTTSVKLPTLPV